MADASTIEAARRALGPIGVFLPFSGDAAPTMDAQRDAVRRLEATGYRAVWTNEGVGGKDALVQLAVLLAATERMVFGTSIANIWARAPQTAHGAATMLADAYPGRFVLGLGVGYPAQAASAGRDFGKPLGTMREYLERMSAPTRMPALDGRYVRVVAANGPKMQALARDAADGAMPAMPEPSATAAARAILGPDKLLIVLIRIDVDSDAAAVPAREHLDAGADHVVLTLPPGTAFATGVEHLLRVAPTAIDPAD
jgi:probable F420-dependent oxidoreductase